MTSGFWLLYSCTSNWTVQDHDSFSQLIIKISSKTTTLSIFTWVYIRIYYRKTETYTSPAFLPVRPYPCLNWKRAYRKLCAHCKRDYSTKILGNGQLNCKWAYRAIIPFADNNLIEFHEISELQKGFAVTPMLQFGACSYKYMENSY